MGVLWTAFNPLNGLIAQRVEVRCSLECLATQIIRRKFCLAPPPKKKKIQQCVNAFQCLFFCRFREKPFSSHHACIVTARGSGLPLMCNRRKWQPSHWHRTLELVLPSGCRADGQSVACLTNRPIAILYLRKSVKGKSGKKRSRFWLFRELLVPLCLTPSFVRVTLLSSRTRDNCD